MLKKLNVKDFALIDDLQINFEKGLTALTGETGSGKSILLESLSLLFGKRSDADMIRHQSKTALVTGVFLLNNEQQKLLSLPETIEISREIDSSGTHKVRLNQELITLSRLKEISSSIGLIHAQNDTFALMDKTSYLDFIDQMDLKSTESVFNDYLLKRSQYLDALKHFQGLTGKRNESVERIDFLSFQVKELESLSLKMNEKTELDEQLEKLSNFDKIKQSLLNAYTLLDNQGTSIDFLYDAHKSLDKVSHYDPSYLKMSETLSDAYYQVDALKNELQQSINAFDFDEESFNDLQERSYELARIETKYHKTVNELLVYLNEIKAELEMITDYDLYVDKAKKLVDKTYKDALISGEKLSAIRKKQAKELEKEILLQLKDLDLVHANFEVIFESKKDNPDLTESGIDHIDFYISLNEGEPIKPLSKVASGGEKARFMFALKSIFALRQNLSLLVLDEIDIGISGKTASKVASKMLELSHLLQLIVITHLPQVAAKADVHLYIEKHLVQGRMTTSIHQLDFDKRVESIAMMLSDDRITSYAIEQAKTLLNK